MQAHLPPTPPDPSPLTPMTFGTNSNEEGERKPEEAFDIALSD